jgi:hypothetical protein
VTDNITIESIDVDGALRDAHESVGGDTRSDFFKKAALGGAGVVAGGGVLAALAAPAGAATKSKKNDVKILNYALTLEYLEAAFYVEAVKGGALSDEVLAAATIIRDHETAHVKALKKALGSAAVKEPEFDFQGTTAEQKLFLTTSIVLEDTGVAAYAGQVPNILQAPVLIAAAQIHSVEARHASRVRSLNSPDDFSPVAFDKPKSMAAVLKAVKKTGFIKS